MLVLFSTISYAAILSMLYKRISFFRSISFIMMNFLGQTTHTLHRLRNSQSIISTHKNAITLLLFVLLICSSILSKSFTSILLNVYTIKKPSLTIQTMDDIINNPDLFVAGFISLKKLEHYRPDIFHALKERVINYHKILNIKLDDNMYLLDDKLIRDIISRKSVALMSTLETELMKLYYPDSNLKESESKYNQLFSYSLVSKNVVKHKEIFDL